MSALEPPIELMLECRSLDHDAVNLFQSACALAPTLPNTAWYSKPIFAPTV